MCYLKDKQKTQLEFHHLGRIRAALRWSAVCCDVRSSKGFSRDLQDTALIRHFPNLLTFRRLSLLVFRRKWWTAVSQAVQIIRQTEDVTYHRIPSDKQRRKAWLDTIWRSNMPQVQYSYVCRDHFLPSCYELNLRSQITTQKCKRRLKEDAIPSEFKYSPEAKKPRLSSENRQDRRRHQEVSGLFCILYCHKLFFR